MATIIKSRSNIASSHAAEIQPVSFSFAEMSDRADDYLETVRGQAAQIISDAHQQAELIRRQAEVAGKQAAEDAIERILDEKVAQQMQTLRPAIESLLSQLEDAHCGWLDHWEQSGVKLSVAIAERIIRREVREQPEISVELLREGLDLAAGTSDITIQLSPTDYESLGKQAHELASSMHSLGNVEVVADADITDGGCRLITRFGEIDQQIESQLERIEAELT